MLKLEHRKITIIKLNIAMFVFFVIVSIINIDDANMTNPIWHNPIRVFIDFLVSIKFLPAWLSAIVLLIGLAVRILDFAVITYCYPNEKNKDKIKYTKKHKIVNIAGIVTLPIWFKLLTFYGMNCGHGFNNGEKAFLYKNSVIGPGNESTFPFLSWFLIPAIIICIMMLVMDLEIIGFKIPKKTVLIGSIVCIVLNYIAPPCVDYLYYGSDYKEDIIKENQYSIHQATDYEYSLNESSAYWTSMGEVYYDEIIDSMEMYPGYMIVDFKFTDKYSYQTLWVTMKGRRVWFGKYQWSVVGSIENYWEDHTSPKQRT